MSPLKRRGKPDWAESNGGASSLQGDLELAGPLELGWLDTAGPSSISFPIVCFLDMGNTQRVMFSGKVTFHEGNSGEHDNHNSPVFAL